MRYHISVIDIPLNQCHTIRIIHKISLALNVMLQKY